MDQAGYIRTVPKSSLAIFLAGVFCLFATIGFASDASQMGRQPLLRFVLSTLVICVCAVGYATAGFLLHGKSWKVMIPIFVVQTAVIWALNYYIPSLPAIKQLDAAGVARLQDKVSTDSLGVMIAMAVGYACFVYSSVKEGRRYFRAHAEIELAHEIHQVLVPTIDAKMGGFEFYGKSLPSGEVGGDLIDVAGTDEKWVAYLADVSGHGVAPGLVMGMTKSASRMLLTSGDSSEHLMPRLNEVIFPLKKPDMFVTFCFVAGSGGRVHVGLAGHPAILAFSPQTNEVTEIECPNMPLGIVPDGAFATAEVEAESGTLFALYTDGLLETANEAGEEFGVARLKAEVQMHARKPLEEICRLVQESVARHGGQFDDQSLLLVRKI